MKTMFKVQIDVPLMFTKSAFEMKPTPHLTCDMRHNQ